MNLIDSFYKFIERNRHIKKFWIGFSGGLDSSVLLFLCREAQLKYSLSFTAIHVNHGISAQSDHWALQCRKRCEKDRIPFHEVKIEIRDHAGRSIEEIARELRYEVFKKYINKDEMLLTAHQMNDQAETFLMHALKGAGLKGLSSMPALKLFAKGLHARPLLHMQRKELEEFAQKNYLAFIDDEMNYQTHLSRAFVRCELLPKINYHFKNCVETLARSAFHIAEGQKLLDEYAEILFASVKGGNDHILLIDRLLLQDDAKQRLIIRYWLHENNCRFPNSKKLYALQVMLKQAKCDRNPTLKWDQFEIKRYRNELYLEKVQTQNVMLDNGKIWNLENECVIENIGVFAAKINSAGGFVIPDKMINVKFRVEGERVLVNGKHRKLKKLFQEWGVPPWKRNAIPLLFVGDELLMVYGYYQNEKYVSHDGPGYDITFKPFLL